MMLRLMYIKPFCCTYFRVLSYEYATAPYIMDINVARCDITHITPNACSGKCSNACGSSPLRVWVAAASEGMISLFEKYTDGRLQSLAQAESVFPSMEAFQNALMAGEKTHALDQLILVGSRNDIAWIHAALPISLAKHVAAEIEYPLMSGWFRQTPPLQHLTHALEHVFFA